MARSAATRSGRVRALLFAVAIGVAALAAAAVDWSTRVDEAIDVAITAPSTAAERANESTAEALELPRGMAAGSRDLAVASEVAANSPSGFVARVRVLESKAGAAPSVAEALVELVYALPGEEASVRALASARTDAEGRALFALTSDRVATLRAASGAARFGARLREPGWQSNAVADESGARSSSVELTILAQRGGTIVGRVRDALGDPARAEVVARPIERLGSSPSTTSNARDGSYALHFPVEGAYEVVVRADGRGTARIREHAVRFTDPPQVLDVELVGPGRVRGRVVDGAGRAVPGLELRVARPAPADRPPYARDEGAAEGLGLVEARAATGVDGRFDFTGLRDDVYLVHARLGTDELALTPEAVAADGRELEFVVERPRIVVRLVDPTGAAWTGERTAGHAFGAEVAWPRVPNVSVGETSGSVSHALVGRVTADGACVFDGVGPGEYDVRLEGGDLAPARRRVRIDEGSGRVDVELVAEPNAIGRLVVIVNELDGEPSRATFAVRLEDVDTRDAVLVHRLGPDHATFWPPGFDTPAGTWRLVVEGREERKHMSAPVEREHGRVERIVRVVAGAETRVEFAMPPGARLRVTLRGDAAPEVAQDRAGGTTESLQGVLADGRRRTIPAGASGSSTRLGTTHASDATFVLRDGDRVVADVLFARAADEEPSPWASPALRFGATRTSQALPAGSYVLVARTHDGRVVEKRVDLADGVTTDVVIDCTR